MKKTSFILLIYFSLTKLSADESYRYFVNLNKVINDKVSVLLISPNINQEVVDFCFPSMVPGTYEIYDFGRFISNLKVLGKNKTKIKIEKIDKNTYRLSPASQIEKITYDVDDTWDECNLKDTKEKIIFEPGGTNFEKGKNFSINTHSMFGYFKGYSNRDFILEFETYIALEKTKGSKNRFILGESYDRTYEMFDNINTYNFDVIAIGFNTVRYNLFYA